MRFILTGEGPFSTLLADPPWAYRDIKGPSCGPGHRPNSYDKSGFAGSAPRYGSMKLKDLLSLRVPMAENAHLYLWTTNAFLVEAHGLCKAWGFSYKTMITWTKIKPDGSPSMKMGWYYRGATEHCLFGVRGRLRLSGPPRPTALLTRRLSHSRKPDEMYDLIEEQSPGPYVELFARRPREGWKQWGNEVRSKSN